MLMFYLTVPVDTVRSGSNENRYGAVACTECPRAVHEYRPLVAYKIDPPPRLAVPLLQCRHVISSANLDATLGGHTRYSAAAHDMHGVTTEPQLQHGQAGK